MKIKQLMLMALAGLCCAVDAEIEESYRATKGKKWNLEIKNKGLGHSIRATIQNGNKLIINNKIIRGSKGEEEKDHGYLRVSDLNLGLPVLITLEDKWARPQITGYMIQAGDKNKTIFVTYKNGILRTQSGKGFFSKETQSGLSLKNNISDDDIEPLDDKVVQNNLREISNKKHAEEARQRALDLEKELQEEREEEGRKQPDEEEHEAEEEKENEKIESKDNKPAKKLDVEEQILRGEEEPNMEELRERAEQGKKPVPPAKKPVVELKIHPVDELRSNIPTMSREELENVREEVKAQKYSTDKKTNNSLIDQIDKQIVNLVRKSKTTTNRNKGITKVTHKFVEPV